MTAEASRELQAARQKLRELAMSPEEQLELGVRKWLLLYAWSGTTAEQVAEVECIMSQGKWRHISAVADTFAGAQWEPGEKAFADGVGFALSALYECHGGPHLATCPLYKEE